MDLKLNEHNIINNSCTQQHNTEKNTGTDNSSRYKWGTIVMVTIAVHQLCVITSDSINNNIGYIMEAEM